MEHLGEMRLFDSLTEPPPKLARRSKGCLTCLQRRVKCDATHPTCNRCRNGFYTCRGYVKPPIFINSGIAQQAHSPTGSKITTRRVARPEHHAGPRPTPFLGLDGFRDKITVTHLFERFRIKFIFLPEPDDAPTISSIFHIADEESSAYIAGRALSEVLFGRLHSESSTTHHSTRLYSKGLAFLRSDLAPASLASTTTRRLYTNLWSSLFFSLYETMTLSAPRNWLQHCQGLLAMVYSLGPHAFERQAARAFLEYNRGYLIASCILLRRKTFLEQRKWKSVSWGPKTNINKSFRVLLEDIYCDIPGYLQATDNLSAKNSGAERDTEIARLRAKIIQAFSDTESLRVQWQAKYPTACHEAPVTDGALPFTSSLKTILRFTNPERAFEINSFNTIRLLLSSLANQLEIPEPILLATTCNRAQSGPHQVPLLSPGKYCPTTYALEICRTVEYMMCCEWDILGAFALIVPLAIASRQLSHRLDMQAWISRVFKMISTEKGFKIAEHATDMAAGNI